jgi:dipeptidyl aminopeptidase/acylaminoacyl peptidase
MRFCRVSFCLLGAALTALGATPALSGQTRSTAASANPADARIGALIETLGKARTPSSAELSPDGSYVAWVVRGQHGPELHLTGIAPAGAQDGAWERVISPDTIGDVTNGKAGACPASNPAWSPDGKQLAFLSDCETRGDGWAVAKQDNLFVWTMATNTMKQVSHLNGSIGSLAWSPDGKSVGFLFVENATRQAGALDAMKPWNGVIGEDGVEIQRVYAMDVASGLGNWISADPKLHVYEFSWSPDSRQITYVAAAPPGENNWWVARLYTQRLGVIAACSGDGLKMCKEDGPPPGSPEVVVDPQTVAGPLHGLQIAVPRFSPDGKQIAFIGGLMSDQGSTGGDLYVVPASGGEPKNLTDGRKSSVGWFTWLGAAKFGIVEHVGGSTHLFDYEDAFTKPYESKEFNLTLPESTGSGVLQLSVSLSHAGTIAFIRSSFEHPPEVWVGPLTQMKQLTHLNDALKPVWGKTESIEWENEGFHVQGWLLYPANYDPAKKYPLLVSVHGGPSSAVTPRWPGAGYGGVPFSALGYFVFMPNPRGSYGQGEKFTQANVKDFGYGDLRDILAGMDVIEKRFPIDKDREGLTGWSYGGFMTMFGVTQTTRFKAAVAGAGISDWQSYYGENSIDQWMVPFFGKTVYDDPAVYAKSSAIDYIKKVKTPTLVVVGDRDGECPAPQSFEFWHALRAEGVKTQLVIYPNEGHRIADPTHQRDVLKRALAWFETEMPAK